MEVPFSPLPLGSVKAGGWLQTQLELQNSGLTGMSEILYDGADDLGAACDWLGGSGNSWERAPYYVKGMIALAYTLDDQELIAKANKWLNWTLNSQQANGFFGPPNNDDWWARMPMLYAIRDHYDATKDERVLPFLTQYFRYELDNLDARPLNGWGKTRAGDNIEIVFWLYNRTEDDFLLSLADKLKTQAYDWTYILTNNTFMDFGADFFPKHNVNVPQGIKMPAIYYQKSGAEADRQAYAKGSQHLDCDHGQPQGMQSGNEMLAGRSSITGLELCSIVEQMQSCETAQMILGDVAIGDQLEKVAFNALPGAVSKDFKGLQYYSQANQVQSVHGNHGFGQQYDNGLMPGAFSGYGCCRFNLHMGWPYFVKNMWAATDDNGLAAMAYGPSTVTAKVGDNVEVSIVETTNYPFDESLTFTLTSSQSVSFPLKLRIPEWCKAPVVKVNGVSQADVISGEFYSINRTWHTEDKVELEFPMHIFINDELNQSVSVQRGPLVYSLKIEENWVEKNDFGHGFKEYEVWPKSDWNYALVVDQNAPDNTIKLQQGAMPQNPYLQGTTPVTLMADAKKIPSWKLSTNGLTACDPPYGPIFSNAATEQVELVPFGSENIRVTCLPVVGQPATIPNHFDEDFNDGDKGWIQYSGSFIVKNGEFVSTTVEGRVGSKAIESSTYFSDFTLDARVQVDGDGNGGLLFRASELALGPDDYKGYYLGLSSGQNQVELGKSDGRWSSLIVSSQTVTANTWYQVRIVTKGRNIKVYVNDMATPKIDFNDDSFAGGAVGVRTYNSLAKWDDINVSSEGNTGVTTLSMDEKVRVYPNPAHDDIHVSFSDSPMGDCTIDLYSRDGNRVLTENRIKGTNNVNLDTSDLIPGVYVLKIDESSNSHLSQIVIN
ncbi:MAG: glycoside hydrolase family 127 protein [Bacteroidales bacterium]|nr:glycoside hydrolase family 127 protein [Bacteroidales bacterium]